MARLVAPLERHPQIDLAFCNGRVIDDHGRTQWGRTTERERRWGRAGLRTGVHEDGRRIASVVRAVPTSHAAVVRRGVALDTALMDARADRAWDMQTASLAVRSNGLVWFERERLARYRVHEGQMSDFLLAGRHDDVTFSGLVFCLSRFSEDPLFQAERHELRVRLSKERTNWALSLLVTGHAEEALQQVSAARAASATARVLAVSAIGAGGARSTPTGRGAGPGPAGLVLAPTAPAAPGGGSVG